VIGEGNFARVVEAWDTVSAEQVAVKILRKYPAASVANNEASPPRGQRSQQEQILNEIRCMEGVDSSRVVCWKSLLEWLKVRQVRFRSHEETPTAVALVLEMAGSIFCNYPLYRHAGLTCLVPLAGKPLSDWLQERPQGLGEQLARVF
jgi:serine/threonine protein kinase